MMNEIILNKRAYLPVLLFIMTLFIHCDMLLMKSKENNKPSVTIKAENDNPPVNSKQKLTAVIDDPDEGDEHTVMWTVTAGELSDSKGIEVEWTAPEDTQAVQVVAAVIDDKDARGVAYKILNVGNENPVISEYTSSKSYVLAGNTITLTCEASDPESTMLNYHFYVIPGEGTMIHTDPSANTAQWISPPDMLESAKTYQLIVDVSDAVDFTTSDTLDVTVYYEYETIWVVDSEHKNLTKYASNGTKILTSSQTFDKPVALANNIDESYGCYVADYNAGSIYKISATGETIMTYTGIPNVIDIAVHHDTRTIWAVSVGENSLTILDGFTDQEIKTIYGFKKPRIISINQASDDIWIVETGNNRVIRLNALDLQSNLPDTIKYEETTIFPADSTQHIFNAPSSFYVRNQSDADVYIADKNDNEIEKMINNDLVFERSEDPVGIIPLRPSYVSVSLLANQGWTVFVMNANGKIVVFPEENERNVMIAPGNYVFEFPHALATDETNSEFWIGDNGTNQLVKIKLQPDYTFRTLVKISGFLFIEDVVINK